MTLVAGTKLGPYEILDAIGAGGMGEVYRARDTRLERTCHQGPATSPAEFRVSAAIQERGEDHLKRVRARSCGGLGDGSIIDPI